MFRLRKSSRSRSRWCFSFFNTVGKRLFNGAKIIRAINRTDRISLRGKESRDIEPREFTFTIFDLLSSFRLRLLDTFSIFARRDICKRLCIFRKRLAREKESFHRTRARALAYSLSGSALLTLCPLFLPPSPKVRAPEAAD